MSFVYLAFSCTAVHSAKWSLERYLERRPKPAKARCTRGNLWSN